MTAKSPAEIRREMVKAVDDQVMKLAHIRNIPRTEAARYIATSFSANLKDSRETSMESYWQVMVEIADQQVASELSAREMSR